MVEQKLRDVFEVLGIVSDQRAVAAMIKSKAREFTRLF
jgi:hypothetical protein